MARARTTEYWTTERLIQEIRRIMDVMGINYMPKALDIIEHSSIIYAISQTGGMKKYAELMGIPMAPRNLPNKYTTRKNHKIEAWDGIEKWTGRPSRAFEMEADARKRGLSYADLQKAETLRMAGRIV